MFGHFCFTMPKAECESELFMASNFSEATKRSYAGPSRTACLEPMAKYPPNADIN